MALELLSFRNTLRQSAVLQNFFVHPNVQREQGGVETNRRTCARPGTFSYVNEWPIERGQDDALPGSSGAISHPYPCLGFDDFVFFSAPSSLPKSRRSGDRNGGPLAPSLGLEWIWDRPWPGIGRCGDSGTLITAMAMAAAIPTTVTIRLWLSGLRLRLRTELRLLRRMARWLGGWYRGAVSHPHY